MKACQSQLMPSKFLIFEFKDSPGHHQFKRQAYSAFLSIIAQVQCSAITTAASPMDFLFFSFYMAITDLLEL
jgi:hypothetical protein